MDNKIKKPKQVMVSCFLAGCLETYDFTIFGLLATVIHAKYFSFMDSGSSLIIAYALFAVGFICRPIGAIIFGYIGDVYGRKVALVTSVSIMGAASLSMCLMPSYESIGIASCYLIALARIMQGISLGGEFGGGIIYAIEHFNQKRTGLVGSSVVTGCSTGILLATLVAYIIKSSSVPEYSWRFAFLLGFGLSIIGFFIRQKLTETPEFLRIKGLKNKMPLIAGMKSYKLESITSVLAGAVTGANLYFVVVYLPTYLKDITGLDLSYLPTITTIILVLLSSFWGWKSDQVGRGKLLVIGTILSGIYALIMLPLIMINPTAIIISLIIAGHAVLLSVLNGAMNVFAFEVFPTECRYSCGAFCHSIGMGLIGGTTPMMAAFITKHSDNSIFVLGFYLCFITLSAGVAVALTTLKQTKNKRIININKDVKFEALKAT
jgi:MHS family proline/betaine transporter-like MFS transporter